MENPDSKFRVLPTFNGWTIDTRLREFRLPDMENGMQFAKFDDPKACEKLLEQNAPNCPWCGKNVEHYEWDAKGDDSGVFTPGEDNPWEVDGPAGWAEENYYCGNCGKILFHDEDAAREFAEGTNGDPFSLNDVIDNADKPMRTEAQASRGK